VRLSDGLTSPRPLDVETNSAQARRLRRYRQCANARTSRHVDSAGLSNMTSKYLMDVGGINHTNAEIAYTLSHTVAAGSE
jgi:hypothetical protein